jgi:hypothetical protein
MIAAIENVDPIFRVRSSAGHFFNVPIVWPFRPVSDWAITELAGRDQEPWF